MRARELAARGSTSKPETGERSTTNGAGIIMCTSEGDPTRDVGVFWKSDPHAY